MALPAAGIPRRTEMPSSAELTIIDHPSPNFGPRREGARPDMVVLHYTAMATAGAALERLCDPAYEVSAHYLIDETGLVFRLVNEEMRAWHAGAGGWGDVTDVNSRSIGVELANPGNAPFSAPQMNALEQLLPGILSRWRIPPERVIGHSDLAPERKGDPGARFDWQRLARQGLAVWPSADERAPARDEAFALHLSQIGYPDAAQQARLAAFRLRFRPGVQGPLDDTDMGLAQNLARRFPVDRTPSNA